MPAGGATYSVLSRAGINAATSLAPVSMTSGSFTNYVPHGRIRIENEEAFNLAETFVLATVNMNSTLNP
jgi:hypothetical protein